MRAQVVGRLKPPMYDGLSPSPVILSSAPILKRFAKAHHDLGQATISFHATSTPGENLITYIRTLLVDFSLFTRLSLKRLATGGRLRKNTKVGASTAAISAPARWELQREFVISAMTRFPKSAKIGSEMRSLLGERPIDYEPLDPEPPRYGRHKHFEINDDELNYNNVRFEKTLNFYEELDELEGYNYLQDLRAQAVTFIVAHREAEWPSRKRKRSIEKSSHTDSTNRPGQ